MTPTHSRLCGLVALVFLVACDDGSAPARDAAPSKPVVAKTKAAEAGPTKATPAPDVKATPAPDVKATPEPAPTTALGAPDPTAEPTATPTDPVADPIADPAQLGGEPPDVDDPNPSETPALRDDSDAPDAPETPAVAAGDGSAPIPLGPDAELLRLVLAHDVQNRQPVDPATRFPAGHKINLFIEARNEGEEEQHIRITWETVGSGRRSPPVGVTIPTRKLHRTRAYRTMKKSGEYRCIVLGPDDAELAVLPFTIE